MRIASPCPRCQMAGYFVGLAVACLFGASTRAAEVLPPPAESETQTKVLNLADCIALGKENSPVIAAQSATLRGAEIAKRSVDSMKKPKCMAPDLPIRRQQSAVGLEGSLAAVEFTEHYTVNAVSRTYYGVVYARAQKKLAEEAVAERLKNLKMAEDFLNAGARQVSKEDVQKFRTSMQLARLQVLEAERGVDILLGALKEAMGLGPAYCLDVADDTLPQPELNLCAADVIELAETRRPENRVQDAASAIFGLEVDAQRAMKKSGRTFAMYSDIHVAAAPPLGGGPNYMPGPIGWEMPVKLAGTRCDRVERASALADRVNAVREKTRQLIALEAQDAYTRFVEAKSAIPLAKGAEDSAREVKNLAEQKYRRQDRLDPDKLIEAEAK